MWTPNIVKPMCVTYLLSTKIRQTTTIYTIFVFTMVNEQAREHFMAGTFEWKNKMVKKLDTSVNAKVRLVYH